MAIQRQSSTGNGQTRVLGKIHQVFWASFIGAVAAIALIPVSSTTTAVFSITTQCFCAIVLSRVVVTQQKRQAWLRTLSCHYIITPSSEAEGKAFERMINVLTFTTNSTENENQDRQKHAIPHRDNILQPKAYPDRISVQSVDARRVGEVVQARALQIRKEAYLPDTIPSIDSALENHKQSRSQYPEYHKYIRMIRRLVSGEPPFYDILSLSSAGMRTHFGCFARFFHLPAVDLGLPGHISPEMRRLVFISASNEFDCSYCTVHACSFGDMFRGSAVNQMKRMKGPNSNSAHGKKIEAIVVKYATAAVQRPFRGMLGEQSFAEINEALRIQLGDNGIEVVKAIIAFTGALNTLTDTLGPKIESNLQNFALRYLKTEQNLPWVPTLRAWNPNLEANQNGNGSDETNFQDEPNSDESCEPKRPVTENIDDLLDTMPSAMAGMAYEALVLYRGIPYMNFKLQAWLELRIGQPGARFFHQIRGIELKRAFCFALRENVFVEEKLVREWSLTQRLYFLYVFGQVTGAEALCNVASSCFERNVSISPASHKGSMIMNPKQFACCSSEMLPGAEASGREMVVCVATALGRITERVIQDLVEKCSPEAIVELTSMLSFFELWRRMDLLFAAI